LEFEYVCKNCKKIFPLYSTRCPNCHQLFKHKLLFNIVEKKELKNIKICLDFLWHNIFHNIMKHYSKRKIKKVKEAVSEDS